MKYVPARDFVVQTSILSPSRIPEFVVYTNQKIYGEMFALHFKLLLTFIIEHWPQCFRISPMKRKYLSGNTTEQKFINQ